MKKHLSFIYKLWNILSPFHVRFYLQLFIILIAQLLVIAAAFLNGSILNSLVKMEWQTVFFLFAAFLFVNLIETLMYYFDQSNRVKHLDQTLFQFLQEFSMKKILHLTQEQHIEEHSALKLSIVARGESAVQGIIEKIATSVIPTLVLVSISSITLSFLHPFLGIILVFVFITIFTWSYLFQKNHYPNIRKNRDNWNMQQKERVEAFEHLTLIKTLAREHFFIKKFMEKRNEVVHHHLFTVLRSVKNNSKRNAFIELCIVFTLGVAVYLYYQNIFAVGVIYTVFSLVNRIYWNISSLSGIMREIPQQYADVEKYLTIIEKEPSFKEGGSSKEKVDGDIVFSNVGFKYQKGESPLFTNLSFTIPKGKIIAIIGESGSGKSTISKLLLRFYDYNSGSITIGGTELRNFTIQHLRESIGYVEQHVDLLDDTIEENILFGVKETQREAKRLLVELIAKKARIDQLYHRLGELKLKTLVGERGVKLSGGERQRVGIARAIIKDPNILIFDEATSALDTENEAKVMEAIREVSQGKTTIIIAHRLSTIKDADTITILDKGVVVDQGSHSELLKRSEYYKNLLKHHGNI